MKESLVLVEAESFCRKGGWKIDSQFIDQMGSPYLIAHGCGTPVEDAVTTVTFPSKGSYRAWVRTKAWTAPFGGTGRTGKFELVVQGRPLGGPLGDLDSVWHWQDCGCVDATALDAEVRLHDLDGFDGRCDAIVFSADEGFVPPADVEALSDFRRTALGLPHEAPLASSFDLVVVGGGVAGIACAVSAARLGMKVALIHDRPVLGGNNSSEVGVTASAALGVEPYPRIGDVTREIAHDDGTLTPGLTRDRWDDRKLAIVEAEDNLALFANMHVKRVRKSNGLISRVDAVHIEEGHELAFEAPFYVDCTGDGNVGFLAGADFRMGRESFEDTREPLAPVHPDGLTLATSLPWYAVETCGPAAFPVNEWGLNIDEETCVHGTRGGWRWQTGWDRDTIAEAESIRDYSLAAIYANWSFLKNDSERREEYTRHRLAWIAYVAGKRESRRLLGDTILSQHDLYGGRRQPDAIVAGSYMIDLHRPRQRDRFPFGEWQLGEHVTDRSITTYAIPWRCLYSRNIPNLMMAGRCVSTTHVAHSTARIINTTGMMGEVIAIGARLCLKHGTTPRGIYEARLGDLVAGAEDGVPCRN